MGIDFYKRNIIDSLTGGTYQWSTGIGNTAGYTANGDQAESQRLYDTDPFGDESIVWQTNPTVVSGPDGGWNTSYHTLDNTKLYRFSVWLRRLGVTCNGDYYFGLTGSPTHILKVSDGTTQTNPYWNYGNMCGLPVDTWYLFVAHVFPKDYKTGTYTKTRHPDTGYYSVAGGKLGSSFGTNNMGGDAKFAETTTQLRHRTYHFYCTNTSAHLQFFDPRIELCDGSEPTALSLTTRSTANDGNNLLSSTSITKEGASYKHQSVEATGGDWTEEFGGWKAHVFTGSSSFVLNSYVGSSVKVDYLIVGGGGGGGYRMGGGGGGGGVLTGYCYLDADTYTITVGAGGAAGVYSGSIPATNGGNSTFNGLTAVGGGSGGSDNNGTGNSDGGNGGSGGGGSAYAAGTPGSTGAGGTGTAGQGYAGGNQGTAYYGGSGGGGSEAGSTQSSGYPATGGTGTFSTILGRPHYWGGGGGCSAYSPAFGGGGGPGGGGGGADSVATAAGLGGKKSVNWGEDGSPNGNGVTARGGYGGPWSGSGGGGGVYSQGNGGAGGSGIVIIRYKYK